MRRLMLGCAVSAIMTAAPAFAHDYQTETLADGLANPWGMAFMPNGQDILITGRGGALKLWRARDGAVMEISGAPEVDASNQGGLLDVALSPNFDSDGFVYMTWSADADGGTTTHVGRGRLDVEAAQITDVEVLFRAGPAFDSDAHYGSRIVFHDGHMFVGLGDRNFKDFGPDHIAQDLSSENGSVIRLTLDGEVPDDNPFVAEDGAAGAIWSFGHRNIQAMTVHPDTGQIWLAEHGEAGGDEINIVQRGGNYGWPLAAFGVDYRTGEPFAQPHEEGDGFIAPAYHWPPGRDAHFPPSGMAFYDGDAFPEWRGHLLVGNLYHEYLGLFPVEGEQVGEPRRLLEGEGLRIRAVAVGPEDGLLYVLADGDDAPLLRLRPARD